jgi:Holliday junction resolvase
MRESKIERYLREQVLSRGGRCFKFTSPGCRAVPDRLVIYQGLHLFVETKATGKRASKLQAHMHADLEDAGAEVVVANSKPRIDALVLDRMDAHAQFRIKLMFS